MAMAIQSLSCARFLPVGVGVRGGGERKPLLCFVPLSSRSRNLCSSSIVAASSNNKNKKKLSHIHVTDGDGDDEEEEDAFELLFKQLEEDLKNDDLLNDDGSDEVSEEDMDLLERELEEALGDYDPDLLNLETSETQASGNDAENVSNVAENGSNGVAEDTSLKLRTWQMKKLARVLNTGRRKTSIKSLAAELCLDRGLVLQLLRNPPPDLLMMSLSVPDEPMPTVPPLETKSVESVPRETSTDRAESGPKEKIPIHTMQQGWSARKRLKRVQLDTLERVYRRSKRPTNAMISSIVHVTNIPRKTVVKWFEDKRNEEGVADNHLPYQRSVAKSP